MTSINGFIPVLTDTIITTGALSIREGYPVGYNGAYAAASVTIAGIAMQDVLIATDADNHLGRNQIGSAIEVLTIGRCKLVAGGAVTAGDYLRVCNITAGGGVVVSVGTTWETGVIGKAITGTAADGGLIDTVIGAL